MNAINLRSFFD